MSVPDTTADLAAPRTYDQPPCAVIEFRPDAGWTFVHSVLGYGVWSDDIGPKGFAANPDATIWNSPACIMVPAQLPKTGSNLPIGAASLTALLGIACIRLARRGRT